MTGPALGLEIKEGTVIADTLAGAPCVFLTGPHRAERAIADRLRQLATGAAPWPPIDADKAIPCVEAGITLAASQRAALRQALASKRRSMEAIKRRRCHSQLMRKPTSAGRWLLED